MKTLGQINHDVFVGIEEVELWGWGNMSDEHKDWWETAAKAVATTVRAETIEECAKLCDTETAIPGRYFAADIRSLASTTGAPI